MMNTWSSVTVSKSMRRSTRGLFAVFLVGSLLWPSQHFASALDKGSRAPEIELKNLKGRTLKLSSLRGKVVLVDFWASWCKPCKAELPVLDSLYRKYKKKGLVIVGVNIDQDVGNMKRFLKRNPVRFPVVHDKAHKVVDAYKPPKMPSSYLVDRKGIVRYVHAGFRASDAAKLEKQIQRILKKR